VIEDAEHDDRRLLLHAKNNLARAPQGLAFRLEQCLLDEGIIASRIFWESEPVAITADQALAADATCTESRSAKSEAMEFLQAALASEPLRAATVQSIAREHGLTPKVIRSAREALGQDRAGRLRAGVKVVVVAARGHLDDQPSHTGPSSDWASMELEGIYGAWNWRPVLDRGVHKLHDIGVRHQRSTRAIDRMEGQRKSVYVTNQGKRAMPSAQLDSDAATPAPPANDSSVGSEARCDVRRRTRARCSFKQTDVTRAVKAVASAGLPVVGVKINQAGDIEVVTGNQSVQDSNSLDKWISNHARSIERR
jgi:hypothetical protein